MPVIHVVKPFTLSLDPKPLGQGQDEGGREVTVFQGEPEKRVFGIGEHDVDDSIANHWYVRAHLEGAVEHNPQHVLYAQGAALAEQRVRQQIIQPPGTEVSDPGVPMQQRVEAAQFAAMSRSGEVSPGAHYFAGQPQVDRPLPGHEPQAPGVAFMPPSPPAKRTGKKGDE
jgi:hypothetical protein